MTLYQYIGPQQIADRAATLPSGMPIRSAADLIAWIQTSGQSPRAERCAIATFVVDASGVLLVADRRSEHVACAGRQPVRSAGEMTFHVAGGTVEITAVSNQSIGYAPEPESWPAVAAALLAAGLQPPSRFELACIFRGCPKCSNVNMVKDGIFECEVCGWELPAGYNCQPIPAGGTSSEPT